jgi:hypothetical protein
LWVAAAVALRHVLPTQAARGTGWIVALFILPFRARRALFQSSQTPCSPADGKIVFVGKTRDHIWIAMGTAISIFRTWSCTRIAAR